MKRFSLFVLIAWLAAACTGTKEPPLELLLAVGEGDRVVFYPAGTEPASALGDWSVGAAVQDLARPVGEARLWVLTAGELLAFPLSGAALDHAPDPLPAEEQFSLGGTCHEGRLSLGERRLLVHCPQLGVWTVSLAAPALEPVDASSDPAGTHYLLGPDDRVVRLRPSADGFDFVYPDPPGDPLEHGVDVADTVAKLAGAWNDEGVLGIAAGRGTDVLLYEWSAGASEPPALRDPALELTGLRGLRALPGGWLVYADSGYVLRRRGQPDLRRSGGFRDVVITPDEYVYLVGPGRLLVLDLLDPDLGEHARSAGGQAGSVAYLPTGP